MINYGITYVKVGIDIPPNQTIIAKIENRVLTAVLEEKLTDKPLPMLVRLIIIGHNLLKR